MINLLYTHPFDNKVPLFLTSALRIITMEFNGFLPRGLGSITIKNRGFVVSCQGTQGDLPITQQTQSAETFPYFNDFPVEIRLKIWRNSFTPRMIYLREDVQDPADEDRFVDRPCRKARSSLPPTAFVNRESREETLKHYCRLFQPLATPSQFFSPATVGIPKSLFPASHLVGQPSTSISNCNIIYWHPKIDNFFVTMEALCDPLMFKYLLDMSRGIEGSYNYIDDIGR
ncbi:hypothetical protein OCU04_003228 [Sclerotinia nivalis]|uniref:2EXR domain-containing protein n=1 Tax=Sclerotinia nivalis TaxID=352851 RepID=A0A9X0AUX6_9HELO|nr:hypothetical protein OCU04_003228 [Sclerotinia nivalis]